MVTYKQEKKEEARKEIWEKSISTLTFEREKKTLINESVIRKMWRYTFKESEMTKRLSNSFEIDTDVLNNFCDFINRINPKKRPQELRIIYFCGPEPENDLEIMLDLGIKIENVWAIEQDYELYNEAIKSVKKKFPTLKIYQLKFKQFCESFPKQKFDLIYLDFTSSLFSTDNAKTVHFVFDYDMLENFGVLVTNNAVPSKEDISRNSSKYLNLLASFFVKQVHAESSIVGQKGGTATLSSYGKDTEKALLPDIKKNFKASYSSFCTLYPIFYANNVSPKYRVFKNETLSSFIVDKNKIKNDSICWSDSISSHFTNNLNNEWKNKEAMFESREPGTQRTRKDSIDLANSILAKSIRNLECNFLNENFKNSIHKSYEIMEPFELRRYFCDIVNIHTLVEFTFFQLGFPYHVSYTNHKRFSYQAKSTEMNIDIFTFDSCRAIYDWYPLFELYENTIGFIEKQIILRMCLDLISGKQATWAPIRNYTDACNMIAINEPLELEYFSGFESREKL